MKNGLFLIGTFFITCFIMELYLQLSEIETPSIVRYDDTLGRKYIPNSIDATFHEGFSLSKTNELGYFFPNYPKKNEKDLIITLIGDSYVNGLPVFDRHHLRCLLEMRLNEETKNDTSYRVLRFGQAGGDISDYYIWYSQEASLFECDMSFVFVDIGDLIIASHTLSPKCVLVDSTIFIDYSFNNTLEYLRIKKLSNLSKSSILRLALKCYKKKDDFKKIIFELNSDTHNVDEQITSKEDYLTDLNRKIIKELDNDEVVFVFKSKMPTFLLSYFVENEIKYIELDPLLEIMMKKGIDPYYWSGTNKQGHWNHQTQKEISEFLADYILHCSD